MSSDSGAPDRPKRPRVVTRLEGVLDIRRDPDGRRFIVLPAPGPGLGWALEGRRVVEVELDDPS